MLLRDLLARQSVIYSIDDLFRADELTQEKLNEAIEGVNKNVERVRMNVLDAMKLVAECRISPDPLH